MFKPNAQKSQESQALIQRVFAEQVDDADQYTVVYGYAMKSGVMSQKMSSYVVGFSPAKREMVIIQIDPTNGNAAKALVFNAGNIKSAKFDLQSNVKIKSPMLPKELKFMVPGYTPTSLDSAYVLPIVQEAGAVAFKKFIKTGF